MMRSRWWAGWCENAIQQSEEMPGMRACDGEERTDRQGHATVEMPGLPAELDDAAARPQTGADAGGVPLMAAGAVVPDGVGIHGRRARPAQADRMVLVNPAVHRPAGREAPHGHGRRHVHGPRLRLIIAIDGESEEVLALQWCAHEELRRCCRRLEKLFREGKLFAFPGPALAAGGPVARTTNRLEGGVNSVVKNVLRNHRGLPEEHMLRACEWVCYMKTATRGRNRSFPTIRWRAGKRRRPNRKATSRPHTGSAPTGTNSTPARDIPTAPTDAENQT